MTVVVEPQGRVSAWLLERIHYVPTAGFVAFGQYSESKRRLIGAVGFDNWSPASAEMHCAGDPGWLTKELLFKAFYYPFVLGGVKVVIARVGSSNAEALRFDTRIGFVEQCRIPDAWDGGEDLVILALHKDNCKWLNMKNTEKYCVKQKEQHCG
mgnify:CR=1 FL=1